MKRRILIVDDETELATLMATMIELLGYEATALSSPEAALDLLGREKFDLVISDFKMPDMSGIELLARSRTAGSLAPPFILCTGLDNPFENEALPTGLVCIVKKPFIFADITKAIHRAIDN